MKELHVRREFVLLVDDDIADFLSDKVIYMNRYHNYCTVIEIDEEEREKSLASIIYFLKTGVWSEAGKTGVHCKDHNKKNLQFDNLELHDWTSVARGKAQNVKEGKIVAFK